MKNAYAVMEFQEEALSQKSFTNSNIVLRKKLEKSWLNGLWKIYLSEKPDVLITVPLHPKKIKKRGYNQLHIFADTLSKIGKSSS